MGSVFQAREPALAKKINRIFRSFLLSFSKKILYDDTGI
jgi:hypothetical protein